MMLYALPIVAPTVLRVAQAAADGNIIKTQNVGWGPGTYFLMALVILLTPIVVAMLRFWGTMSQIKSASDGSMRKDLLELMDGERKDCRRQIGALQNKMDAMTRQFVSFQIIVAQALPEGAATHARAASDRLMDIIMRPVEEFAPSEYELEVKHQEDVTARE